MNHYKVLAAILAVVLSLFLTGSCAPDQEEEHKPEPDQREQTPQTQSLVCKPPWRNESSWRNAPHAWRNLSSEPVVMRLITTKRLGRFFQETGRPVTGAPRPVTPEDLAHFAAVSARYGYWNATPEENAAVGIPLSF